MSSIRIVKRQDLSNVKLTFDDDRAITEFRAFFEVGKLHIDRVRTQVAADDIESILTELQNRLKKRQNLV